MSALFFRVFLSRETRFSPTPSSLQANPFSHEAWFRVFFGGQCLAFPQPLQGFPLARHYSIKFFSLPARYASLGSFRPWPVRRFIDPKPLPKVSLSHSPFSESEISYPWGLSRHLNFSPRPSLYCLSHVPGNCKSGVYSFCSSDSFSTSTSLPLRLSPPSLFLSPSPPVAPSLE